MTIHNFKLSRLHTIGMTGLILFHQYAIFGMDYRRKFRKAKMISQ